MTADGIPAWLRALIALARGAESAARAAAALRDAAALAFVPHERRAAITTALFSREMTYAPGGATFSLGLLPWEEELLGPPFPAAGRLLVGGAGGGREAAALRARGYEIVAFDPAAALVRAGAPSLARQGVPLLCAGYDDVVRVARGHPSPLGEALAAPFDGVLLGWGSVSLVLEDADRRALLSALRALAPDAPVALSFDEPTEPEQAGTLAAGVRRAVHRLARATGGGSRVRFSPWAGFIRESTGEEIAAIARAAGYRVAKQGAAPGRMLLMPAGDAP